jgi:hypothetical protein
VIERGEVSRFTVGFSLVHGGLKTTRLRHENGFTVPKRESKLTGHHSRLNLPSPLGFCQAGRFVFRGLVLRTDENQTA